MRNRLFKLHAKFLFIFGLVYLFFAFVKAEEVYASETSVTSDHKPVTYYVSPNGSDDEKNKGTSIDTPFKTIGKVAKLVKPGDTVYLREGVYHEAPEITISGESGKPITWECYQNEKVIIDGSDRECNRAAYGALAHQLTIRCAYNIFKGFSVINGPSHGIHDHETAHDNTYIDIESSNHNGKGFYIDGYNNTFIRCVSSYNFDFQGLPNDTGYDNPGEHGDGFGLIGKSNTLIECVAYNNSDDGYDTYNGGYNEFRKCVAYENGTSNGCSIRASLVPWQSKYGKFLGDGNGFKLGNGPYNIVIQCISYKNTRDGFSTNGGIGNILINCTAYDNLPNYNLYKNYNTAINCLSYPNVFDIPEIGIKTINQEVENYTKQYTNSWNSTLQPEVQVTANDFLSLDPSSPNFLKLSPNSKLVNSGTALSSIDLSNELDGREIVVEGMIGQPDIGAYECDLPISKNLPVISNIKVEAVTTNEATITWNTNRITKSKIEYGTSDLFGQSTSYTGEYKKEFSQKLTNLKPDTVYYFRIVSTDNNGVQGISDVFAFTTDFITPEKPANTVIYEAEAGLLENGARISREFNNYSGDGFVCGFGNDGAKVSFKVNVPVAADYKIFIRYANASEAEKSLSIYVNGTDVQQTFLPKQSSWRRWVDKEEIIHLNAGENIVSLVRDPDDGGCCNIDFIAIDTSIKDYKAPAITEITTNIVSEEEIEVNWSTDENSYSYIEYGETSYYGYVTDQNKIITTQHSVRITDLTPGTTYYYRIISKDAEGNTSCSEELTFTTKEKVIVETRYEAEAATLTGGARKAYDHEGYSGSGFVCGYGNDGADTEFTVKATSAGLYRLCIRYANASGSDKSLSIYVNGVDVKQTIFAKMSAWNQWADCYEIIELKEGINTISLRRDLEDGGCCNIDYIEVNPLVDIKIEAEDAQLSGGAFVANDLPGYSGDYFVCGYGNEGAETSFDVNIPMNGEYTVVLQYANASENDKTLSVYVNGVDVQQVMLYRTANWMTVSKVYMTLQLKAGDNKIAFRRDPDDGGTCNLDYIIIQSK